MRGVGVTREDLYYKGRRDVTEGAADQGSSKCQGSDGHVAGVVRAASKPVAEVGEAKSRVLGARRPHRTGYRAGRRPALLLE